MGYKKFDERSILKSDTIKKVLLNKKDYKFQDFQFKVTDSEPKWEDTFNVEVYDFDTLILTVEVGEQDIRSEKGEQVEERFDIEVIYFNPQTNNDCLSINHIIACCSSLKAIGKVQKDNGNAQVLNNQYIFRRRDSYYSYVKVWNRGNIKRDNFNKGLSYEFATNEYINYVKKIYGFKKIQRRKIKEKFSVIMDKLIVADRLK